MTLKKQRDSYFDNLKFILILLVVIGHLIEPIKGNSYTLKFIYALIFSFHMPLFAFVSGYFSKNYKLRNLIDRIVIPYMTFQVLYFVFDRYFLGAKDYQFTFFEPYWIMWYLLALCIWQLIIPVFNFKSSIIVTILIGILVGYDTSAGYYLSLSRVIYFFPFFLIGNKFDKDKFLNLIPQKYKKSIPIIGAISISMVLFYFTGNIDVRFFYGSFSYAELSFNMWYAGIYRLLLYSYTILISFFILYLIPATKNLSSVGSRTLNIYLLHGFLVKLFIKYNLYKYLITGFEIWFLIILGVAITYILSLKIFSSIIKTLSLSNCHLSKLFSLLRGMKKEPT